MEQMDARAWLWLIILVINLSTRLEAVEIDLLEDFEINERMDGILETTGLQYEGKAFLFGDKKDNLVKKGELVNEIARQAKIYGGLIVSANVKMDQSRECTLLWIETIYTQPVLGIWVTCAETCRLNMLYMINYRSYEVSFDSIGPLDDTEWHKLVVHVGGMKKGEESVATVYVDCAKQGEQKLREGYTHLMPFIKRNAMSSQIWLAQRSRGRRGGFEKPWRGSLQNVQFIFNRDIEKLVDSTTCSNVKTQKALSPPVADYPVDIGEGAEGGASDQRIKILPAYTQNVENILIHQVEETKYLRRLIENLHYGGFTKRKTCALNPCYYSVTCTDTPQQSPGYKCGECPMGMEGDGAECTDIDECALNPCFPTVRCQNIAVGYRCDACPKGYRGGVVVGVGRTQARRKQVCRDVDECAESKTACATFSECVNTVGSYKCGACPEGYYGDPYVECKVFAYCTKPKFNPCHLKADCMQKHRGRSFECVCQIGYVGDGLKCGLDSDMDGVPDYALACTGPHCVKDNCVSFPNPDQSDIDGDGKGDSCDDDMDADGIPNVRDNCPTVANGDQRDTDGDSVGDACDNCPGVPNKDQTNTDGDSEGDACDSDKDNDGHLNDNDNCPLVVNERQEDRDKDGVGDHCDNCPEHRNSNQEDSDEDFIGDACDTDNDRDGDGIQDNHDNCPSDPNSSQLDNDQDGQGDECDRDDDNDGIIDLHDNCPYLSNRFQKLSAWHGRGGICKHDYDGDTVKDKEDACPKDKTMSVVDFRKHIVFNPATTSTTGKDEWIVNNEGKEVRKDTKPEGPTMFIGDRAFESVQYNGTLFVDGDEGNNLVGLVFGYQNSKSFYVVTWNRKSQANADVGVAVKEIASSTGPSDALRNALWGSTRVRDQVKIIWKDAKKVAWQYRTAYKWALRLNSSRMRARLDIYQGTEKIVSSPELRAWRYKGGRLGMFTFSQGKVIWTNLAVKCL